MRHIIITLLLSILLPVAARASSAVGSWEIYPVFSTPEVAVATDDAVWFTSRGQLYSRDITRDETINWTASGRLSSPAAEKIFFDPASRLVVVTYTDANIDIITPDGRVNNLPDIKDATLTTTPVINDIAFSGNKIYVATNFGAVVFDSKRHEVVTAGDWGYKIANVAVMVDNLWLVRNKWEYFRAGKDDSLISLQAFPNVFGFTTSELRPLGSDGLGVFLSDGNKISIARFDRPKVEIIKHHPDNAGMRELTRLADGSLMCHTDTRLATISPDGTVAYYNLAGTPLEKATSITSRKGLSELWVATPAGLASYSIDPSTGTVTLLSAPYSPQGLAVPAVGRLATSATGKVYVSSYGYTYNLRPPFNATKQPFGINVIHPDGSVTNATPTEFTVENAYNTSSAATTAGFRDGTTVLEDPNDPDAIYVGSSWDGLYHFKDGRQLHKYYEGSSSMKTVNNGWCLRVYTFAFDKRGNLWTTPFILEGGEFFHMLPREKLSAPSTTAADWQVLRHDRESSTAPQLLALRHNDMLLYKDEAYRGELLAVKLNGTTSTADDVVYSVNSLVDQDGLSFTCYYYTCMAEDHEGRVWVGTDNGIFEITNPSRAINGNTMTINHLKVPRNDGTNFADYLLDTQTIMGIAVDHANRKWVATAGSGVYLISPRGDQILRHFDMTNSPLPTNTIYAVTCGCDNRVYFGTEHGLIAYTTDAGPSQPNYSNVYVYPNPVTPDFTGYITVSGLMEDSLVKIADTAGNIVHQGRSSGGTLVWDGTDATGNRCATGVYHILASSGNETSTTGSVVAKLLIVN